MTTYAARKRGGKRGRALAVGLMLVIVVAAAGGIAARLRQAEGAHAGQSVLPAHISSPSAQPAAKLESAAGRYLFNGTIYWARAVERDAQRKDRSIDYAQPFSQLDTFNRATYDVWSADFECPITTNTVPYQVEVDQLIFNCKPEFLPEAAKYFNLYDLANNHTDNQGGSVGLESTRKYFDATPGVQYFGSFDPSVAGDVCEVVAMPVRLQKSDKTEEKSAIPIAMCAWHYFYRRPRAGELEVMQRYANIMPVFAFTEMGTEYQAAANSAQVDIAHQVIDQGPEFLISNQPHWVQNTEVYKGKLIVYSTGNFIYDQIDAETMRSASIDVAMTVPYDANVAKWVALAPACAKFHDDCLEQAEKQGLTKIKPAYTFGVVAGQGGAHRITHRADAAAQTAVEQRMNWPQTLKQLGQQ